MTSYVMLFSICCVILSFVFLFFFFFKQKTAYEMRISDWSSDVCSSDLTVRTSKADRLPTVSGTVGASYDNYLNTLDDAVGLPGAPVDNVQKSSRAGLPARIPLYQGGAVASPARPAQAQQSQALENLVLTERFVDNQPRASFPNIGTAPLLTPSTKS